MFAATNYAARAGTDACETALIHAAHTVAVPQSVLRAIAITESGRRQDGRTTAWPWTVNMEGHGLWFSTQQAATNFARAQYDQGARSFDVGCFQINYKWHHQHFRSLEDMFDPQRNALYAAHYLRDLYAEFGNWHDAAGAYHSRTPELAAKYKARFAQNLQSPAEIPPSPTGLNLGAHGGATATRRTASAVRENTYPLLLRGPLIPTLGSLVPIEPASSAGLAMMSPNKGEQS